MPYTPTRSDDWIALRLDRKSWRACTPFDDTTGQVSGAWVRGRPPFIERGFKQWCRKNAPVHTECEPGNAPACLVNGTPKYE